MIANQQKVLQVKQNRGPRRRKGVGKDKVKTKSLDKLPKREEKLEVVQQAIEKKQKKKYATKGSDPRSAVNQVGEIQNRIVQGAISTILVKAPIQIETVEGVITAFILQLCERGFYANVSDPNTIFYAYNYLMQIMYASVSNSAPQSTKLPVGLKLLYDALQPTRRNFKTGEISYTWDTALSSWGVPAPYLLNTAQGTVNYGIPTSTLIDGFSVYGAPGGYTTDLGALAWQQVLDFMSSLPNLPMTTLVDFTRETIMLNDVSAFHAVYSEEGFSTIAGSAVGSMTTEVFGETFTTSPIFAKFAEYDTTLRSFVEARITGGSLGYLGYRLMTFMGEGETRNKGKPIPKFIDIIDIYNSLSQTLGNAFTYAVTNNADAPISTCPLTVQQVLVLIRTMAVSYSTAPGAYDCAMSTGVIFYPIQPNPGDIGVTNVAKRILLPHWIVENLRALTPIRLRTTSDQQTNVEWYPVFGTWSGTPVVNYLVGPPSSPVDLYTTNGLEVPFNINTGQTTAGDQLQLAGDQLNILIERWNEWIGLLKPFMTIGTFNTEGSAGALTSLIYTRYVWSFERPDPPVVPVVKSILAVGDKRRSVEKSRGFKLERRERLRQSVPKYTVPYYENIISISSNTNFIDATYSTIIQNWVLPKIQILNFDSTVAPYRTAAFEPYEISNQYSVDITGVSLYPQLSNAWIATAENFVYPLLGTPSEADAALKQADKEGEGGYFAQTLADFAANALGIPMISMLGSLIPF